jgi:lipopolysaccharide heptosyltransferase I
MEGAKGKQKMKRILIIKPSALGDIVLALPALASLRASLPKAKISWFIRPEYAPLLDGVDGIDEVIGFDRKLLGKWWYNPKAFAALVRLVGRLRRARFDLVIDLQGLLRTALFAWLTRCKRRFGMDLSREFATLFYTHKIAQDTESIHVIDYYQKVVSAAGASVKAYEFNLTPMSEAIGSIAGRLTEYGVRSGRYAVFVPGSTHASKCWPVENFAVLADKITSKFDLSIIAVGTNVEKPLVRKLEAGSNVQIIDFAGLTDIPQLIALLSGAKVVVSNDTGPGHIAAALGVPVVMIFGATNPARIRPHGRHNTVAAIEPNKRGCEIESSDPKYTIEAVTVEHVLEKVTCQLRSTDTNLADAISPARQ